MKKEIGGGAIAFSILLVFVLFAVSVSAGNVLTVHATVPADASYLMIDVNPNSIDFGVVGKNTTSSEKKVCVNNTGTENVSLIPQLPLDYSGKILDNVEIRTVGSSTISHKKIGLYSVNLNSTNPPNDQKCMWFRLNLTTYTDPVYLSEQNEEVTIFAVPQ